MLEFPSIRNGSFVVKAKNRLCLSRLPSYYDTDVRSNPSLFPWNFSKNSSNLAHRSRVVKFLDTLKKKKNHKSASTAAPMKHKKHPCRHYGGRRAMEQKKQLLRLIKSYNEWDGRGTKCRIYRSKILTILKVKDKKLGVHTCCWFHSHVYDRHDMNYKYYSSQLRGQHRLMMDWMMDSSQVEPWENMCV